MLRFQGRALTKTACAGRGLIAYAAKNPQFRSRRLRELADAAAIRSRDRVCGSVPLERGGRYSPTVTRGELACDSRR